MERLEARVREAARASSPAEAFRRTAAAQRELAAASRAVIDELQALERPDDDDLQAWLADVRRTRALREEVADAYGRRDPRAIAGAAAAADRLDVRTDALARRRGMPSCARAV